MILKCTDIYPNGAALPNGGQISEFFCGVIDLNEILKYKSIANAVKNFFQTLQNI